MDVFETAYEGAGSVQAPKIFTLEEANRTLPLVRRIVADIVHTYRQLSRQHYDLPAPGHSPPDRHDLEERRRALIARLREYIDELADVGCELKDWRLGLVDFRAVIGGREVYLCWQLGEPEIRFWHDIDRGFADRQPIGTPHPLP